MRQTTDARPNPTFSFEDYVQHLGRRKSLPAFDAFDLSAGENSLFGNESVYEPTCGRACCHIISAEPSPSRQLRDRAVFSLLASRFSIA